MQIGVIVAGTLAAGLWVRAYAEMHFPLSFPVALLTRHYLLLFTIPVGWTIFAASVNNRPQASENLKTLALLSSVLVLVALIVFVGYADIAPFFSITWGLAGDDDR